MSSNSMDQITVPGNDTSLPAVDFVRIVRNVSKTVSKVQSLERQKKELKLLFNPRKMVAKLGVFPPVLYEARSNPHRISQQNGLSGMPNEILGMVLKGLTDADKTSLSLTCKQFCEVAEQAKKLQAIAAGSKRRTVTREMRLAVLIRLHDWMPSEFKLCYSCVKFLRYESNHLWRGDVKIKDQKLATKKAINSGPRCGSCVKREEFGAIKARADVQRLRKMVQNL